MISTHAPAGGATRSSPAAARRTSNFYSRPCGRGDLDHVRQLVRAEVISTHAPAGGATWILLSHLQHSLISTHAPAGGATTYLLSENTKFFLFLLTPLREGRREAAAGTRRFLRYFYSRPCGRGDCFQPLFCGDNIQFLLTPLREGRLKPMRLRLIVSYFYSRPCGRGDHLRRLACEDCGLYFYSRPCGRGD